MVSFETKDHAIKKALRTFSLASVEAPKPSTLLAGVDVDPPTCFPVPSDRSLDRVRNGRAEEAERAAASATAAAATLR